jgi:ParB-like chromosome segregation protein Spo0J
MSEISIPERELVDPRELRVDGDNPNKMTEAELQALLKSIQKYGFIKPIITNKDLLISDGEQKLTLALREGWTQVPIIRLPLKDVDRRILRQVLNKLSGRHDPALDVLEYKKIIQAGRQEELQQILDLSSYNLEKQLKQADKIEKENKIPDSFKEIDEAQTKNECPACGHKW